MKPFLTVSMIFAACLAPESREREVRTARWRDMIVESRPLPADQTFSAVGLRPHGERDDGATEWSWDFTEQRGATREDFVLREFRLTVVNRGASPRQFHARIDYFDPDGERIRRKELEPLLVPPFTESTWIGTTRIRAPGEAEVLARVLPIDEPFDPVTKPSRR